MKIHISANSYCRYLHCAITSCSRRPYVVQRGFTHAFSSLTQKGLVDSNGLLADFRRPRRGLDVGAALTAIFDSAKIDKGHW